MEDEQNAQLGERIRAIRKALGYKTSDVASAAGIDRMTLVRIEDGSSRNPRVETLRAIMRALHFDDEGASRLLVPAIT